MDHGISSGTTYATGVEAIFISAPRRFEWCNFQGKATRTDGTTTKNVKHLKFSVPKDFGPQNLIRSELRNERRSDLISAPRQFEWFNFQSKATRTDGTTAENAKHLEFYVPKGFGPQNLIRSELRNERGSDLHLRATAVRMVQFSG